MNSAGNTPYIVTSPPLDSPTSNELALPHKQMIEHVARLLNIEEEEICRQFPTVRSLLPIDRSPPVPTSVLTPDTLMMAYSSTTFNDIDNYEGIHASPNLGYPRTELTDYVDPNHPNSPPIPSPKPLPVPPPYFHDSMSITPPVTSVTNSTYTLPVIPAFIEDVPSCSPSPIAPMAMVLYQQAKAKTLEAKAMDADVEGRTPSPTGPQPGIFPGPGWKDNFNAVGMRHFFVIPDGNKDVIAPFISYDLHTTFPELLATNGHGCTVHSFPLHAYPVGQHHTAISPKDELLLTQGAQFTDLVDWALKAKDDATLQGEVQYFCTHHSKARQIAHRIRALKESLQNKRLAMYRSSDHLAAASTVTCTRPLTSRAREVTKPKSLFAIGPSKHGARTAARCAIGMAGQATASKTVTVLGIAVTAHAMAMMALIVFILTTSATSSKTVRFILLTVKVQEPLKVRRAQDDFGGE